MLKSIAVRLITNYQNYIRPGLPVGCRFSPSCSEYAKQALIKYGFLKGTLKALKRILACQPFSGESGYHPLV